MTGFRSDVRHAWRSLTRRPMFAAITIATLALGLGATIAMFTVADAVLLRPLPFPHDEQLVVATERNLARNNTGVSFPAWGEWREIPEVSSVAVHTLQNLLFQRGETSARLAGVNVSPEFFSTLRVQPALGRTMQPGDPEIDPDRKIVLSDDVWRRFFDADASVVGRTIMLEGQGYEVLGVMPQGFGFPAGASFWTTLSPFMTRVRDDRSLRFLEVIARMTPGADVATLERRLADWKQRTATLDPSSDKWAMNVQSLRDQVVGQVRRPLMIVFLGVGFLLLVSCCNAAALVLAHGRTKLRDLAVQSALGAGRGRLVRQMLVEGLLLSLASAALAVLIAALTRDGIVALSANQIPRVEDLHVGWRTAVFAIGAGLVTTLLVTLAPALAITRASHSDRLSRGSRSTTASGAGRRMFGPLIAVEFALALLLASAASLLVASYRHLTAVDAGFQPASVVTAGLAVPLNREWSGNGPNRRLNATLLENLRAEPGVTHAAIVSRLPLSEFRGGTDLWPVGDEAARMTALMQLTSEDYFTTMGSRLVAGRDFSSADTESSPTVAIVNDVLAKRLWPGRDPLGQRLTYRYMMGDTTAEVVGVVPAIRYGDLTTDTRPELYVTFRQASNTPVSIVVKSALDTPATAAAVRSALSRTDPTHAVTLTDISTLDAQLARVLARPRFYLVMVLVFAVVAVLLAALGIYGTMMFWVGERWREFGIRVALGAKSGEIATLLIRHGLSYAGAGLVVGLVFVIAGRQVIASLLFQVAPADPIVLGAAISILVFAAVVAALVPARRVTRVDPVATLRAE